MSLVSWTVTEIINCLTTYSHEFDLDFFPYPVGHPMSAGCTFPVHFPIHIVQNIFNFTKKARWLLKPSYFLSVFPSLIPHPIALPWLYLESAFDSSAVCSALFPCLRKPRPALSLSSHFLCPRPEPALDGCYQCLPDLTLKNYSLGLRLFKKVL